MTRSLEATLSPAVETALPAASFAGSALTARRARAAAAAALLAGVTSSERSGAAYPVTAVRSPSSETWAFSWPAHTGTPW